MSSYEDRTTGLPLLYNSAYPFVDSTHFPFAYTYQPIARRYNLDLYHAPESLSSTLVQAPATTGTTQTTQMEPMGTLKNYIGASKISWFKIIKWVLWGLITYMLVKAIFGTGCPGACPRAGAVAITSQNLYEPMMPGAISETFMSSEMSDLPVGIIFDW